MGKNGNIDPGTGELAPRAGEFLAGVLALSRISRVTVALESGHGAGPALRAAASLTAHAECCVLFDRWRDNPLADLVEVLFHSHPELAPAPGESLIQALRTLQARERCSFLLIFDRFDDYLGQAADQAQVAAFDRAFVQMANDSELDVHFLLVLDENAEALLGRFQNDIPGLGDGCLRMPAGGIGDSANEAPASVLDAGRASRRDRSFGMLLERLTTIAPGDKAAASRPDNRTPAVNAWPPKPDLAAEAAEVAEVAPAVSAPKPDADGRHVGDDTVVNEAPPARQEPVFAMQEPDFAPPPAEDREVPAAMAAAPRRPADPPEPESMSADTPPRRGKALMAFLAVFMAVGAGLYAYKQQGPSATANTANTTNTANTSATVAETTSPATPAATAPATTPADRPLATSPAPALIAAPTSAASSAAAKVLTNARAAAAKIWVRRMRTPENGQMGRSERPCRNTGSQPPTVQTGKAYHIRFLWPNAPVLTRSDGHATDKSPRHRSAIPFGNCVQPRGWCLACRSCRRARATWV